MTNCKVTFCHSPVDGDRCFGLQNVCKNSLKYTLDHPSTETRYYAACEYLFIQLIAVPMVGPLFKNAPIRSKKDKKGKLKARFLD